MYHMKQNHKRSLSRLDAWYVDESRCESSDAMSPNSNDNSVYSIQTENNNKQELDTGILSTKGVLNGVILHNLLMLHDKIIQTKK